jgi:hypothetical protein
MDSIHDDVTEFASLLTGMKERTDRSYAALARRLGMNASTLHRYCAGEAVPLDFAGVERFAALCGASPEERLELHHRWIRAVAARQRGRPSDARQAPAPPGTASPAAPVGPDSAAAPVAPARDGGPAVKAVKGVAGAEAARPSSSAGRRPRAGRRRRSVRSMAMAASLVVVLGGLTTSAADLPAAPGDPSASWNREPTASVDRGPSAAAPGEPSASASGVPTASGGTTTKPSGPPTRSGGPERNRASGDTAPPVAPVTWTANTYALGCGDDYVIAAPPQQVPPPPYPEDATAWATSQRAVHGRTTDVRITLQGRGSAAVVLEALHVRVVNRATPAADRGSTYFTGTGCGAGLNPRYFSVNLDARRPLARSMPGDNAGTPIPAVNFPYRVSLQEPEVLQVSALTEACTCDWYLDLDWSSQGHTGTVRIDDHGSPFRTTSTEGLPHYRYNDYSYDPGRWVPVPAGEADLDG